MSVWHQGILPAKKLINGSPKTHWMPCVPHAATTFTSEDHEIIWNRQSQQKMPVGLAK
jgi:hypothetical protein